MASMASRTTLCPRPAAPLARRSGSAASRRAPRLTARAMQSGKPPREGLRGGVENMLAKYDFLSTGMGALCVTSFCVVCEHQDPFEALQITLGSMVVGLVLNEVLFDDEQPQR